MRNSIKGLTTSLWSGIQRRLLNNLFILCHPFPGHVFACFLYRKEGFMFRQTSGHSWMRVSPDGFQLAYFSSLCSK